MLECGCTATMAVVQGRRLLLGDVGDSQAVLGSCESSAEGTFNAEVDTYDTGVVIVCIIAT